VVGLFVDAPPLAERARALVGAFDRVLTDRELLRMHVLADYETIVEFWQTAALSEAERVVLPELAGAGAALRYSLESLREAHAGLSAVVPDESPDFSQLLARLIRVSGLSNQPPAVGQILGIAGWDVEHALAELRDGFDPRGWLARNGEWLERAVGEGQQVLARSWAAAATRVSVHLSGVMESGTWPELEVPDLGAFFQIGRDQVVVVKEVVLEQAPVVQVAPVVQEEVEEPVDVVQEEEPPVVVPAADADGPLAELEALVGLESVKESVRRMVAEIKTNQRRKEFGLPTQERARHMVFVGKPGTAKTSIARLLGRIYKQLGVLEKGHVVEVDRSDLVGSAVGSTAPMTAAKFREALGGVLFVDEAYTLVPENIPGDFGHEAVATLLKMMEDYRDEVVVIMAGYHREIQRLMESNTGLASRFPKLLAFSEYDTDQLVAIFALQARQKGMIVSDEVMAVVRRIIPPAPRGHNFGNGRFIRNVLEEAISNQSTRLALRDPDSLTERDLRELLPEDIKPAASMRAEDYLLQRPGT
jgi:AAA+ superfamily predicted ATPase